MKLHFGSFKLFPVQKLIFGHFWNCKKMEFGQNNFSWNWFIWFHEFFLAWIFKNFLALLIFGYDESCYILMFSGFFFHIGMAAVRYSLDENIKKLYKEGMNRKTNTTQFTMGLACCITGMLGYIYKWAGPTVGQKIKKGPGQKNSWNQINRFHEIYFDPIPSFGVSKIAKNQFWN